MHTDHFTAARFPHVDTGLALMPDSPFRLQRLQSTLGPAWRKPRGPGCEAVGTGDADAASHSTCLTRADVEAALRDHAGHPYGVCAHPDLGEAPVHQEGTILSLVMDVTDRRMWLADGNPCRTPYREVDTGLLRDQGDGANESAPAKGGRRPPS